MKTLTGYILGIKTENQRLVTLLTYAVLTAASLVEIPASLAARLAELTAAALKTFRSASVSLLVSLFTHVLYPLCYNKLLQSLLKNTNKLNE